MSLNVAAAALASPTGVASQIQSVFGPVSDASSAGEGSGFSGLLKSALNQVAGLQNTAQTQVDTVVAGGNADMSKVMVSVEKADVAFQLMMQVRNKIVNAYEDMEKMQF